MKKIEELLSKFCQVLDKHPNKATFIIWMICLMTSLIIHKYRKKDEEELIQNKIFMDTFFPDFKPRN